MDNHVNGEVNGNDETVNSGFNLTVPGWADLSEKQTIPNNFPSIVRDRDLNLKDVSKQTGISQAVLYNLLNQTTIPQRRTLEKLAEHLGLHSKEVFPNYKAVSRISTLAKFKTHTNKYPKVMETEKLSPVAPPVVAKSANSVNSILDDAKAKLAAALNITDLDDIQISFTAKISGQR